MHRVISDMFTLGAPLAESIARPVLVYIFLVVALRLAGKRELAQVNSFDLVVLLTLSNLLQNAGIGADTSVLGGWIGAASLLIINYLVVRLLFGHPKIGRLVEGSTTTLIDDGKILYDNLEKELITYEEVIEAIHRQGVEEVGDVRRCEISPTGAIDVFERHPTELEQMQATEQAVMGRLDELLQRMSALESRLAEAKT